MYCRKLAFLVSVLLVETANGASIGEQQAASIVTVRELLKSELPESYMLEDYWLANWLKANDFSVESTIPKIKQYLQLRKDESLDNIMKEDWSEMRTLFPFYRNTTDKTGSPVVYGDISQFNIAEFLTTKEASSRLKRYLLMLAEESEAQIRQLRAEGRDVSRFSSMYNIAGFSPSKHLSKQFASFYTNVAALLEPQAAAHMERSVFVNVPNQFKMAYFLVSEDTRKRIQLHGQDQDHLEKMLVEFIDRDQIPHGILGKISVEDNSEGTIVWDKEL